MHFYRFIFLEIQIHCSRFIKYVNLISGNLSWKKGFILVYVGVTNAITILYLFIFARQSCENQTVFLICFLSNVHFAHCISNVDVSQKKHFFAGSRFQFSTRILIKVFRLYWFFFCKKIPAFDGFLLTRFRLYHPYYCIRCFKLLISW